MFDGKTAVQHSPWQWLAPVDEHCFGCGDKNPHGLAMRFESNGEMLRSTVEMAERFRGWSNLIHGGVLSTLLDEMMGWTVIVLTGKFMLTRTMQVNFKRPVRVGARLTVTGRIKERIGERRVLVVAEIRDEGGQLCVMSEGEFALFSRDQFLKMGIMSEQEMDTMAQAMG